VTDTIEDSKQMHQSFLIYELVVEIQASG